MQIGWGLMRYKKAKLYSEKENRGITFESLVFILLLEMLDSPKIICWVTNITLDQYVYKKAAILDPGTHFNQKNIN